MDDFGLFSVLYLIIALAGFPYAYIDYGYRGIIAFYLVEQSVVCAVFVAGYWSVLRSGQDIIMFYCKQHCRRGESCLWVGSVSSESEFTHMTNVVLTTLECSISHCVQLTFDHKYVVFLGVLNYLKLVI